ncbi:MAG: ribokinase [Arenimonas sp.]|nr:ribokinase [Arenimonas sp.]
MARVVVVGSYNQDHVWTTDALPAPGATRLGRYASGPGGKGFNQAVASARVGAPTTFITALGEDAAADAARALATDDGIALRAEIHPALPSGTAGIFVDGDGRNVIVVAPGANEALSVDFIAGQPDAFAQAAVVLAQLEVQAGAVLAALQAGRQAGATTMLNPAPANAPTSDALLAAADILTPNETEFVAMLARHARRDVAADSLADMPAPALHALCRQLAPAATLVITLGAGGVFVSHRDGGDRGDKETFYRLPCSPAKVLDTTGAGDAFNGALAARLADAAPGTAFRDAVAFANTYAGWSTELAGGAASMRRLHGVTP